MREPVELLRVRRAELQEQRLALVASIQSLRTTRSLDFADDEHDPDGSTVSLDQARDTALLARVEASVSELDIAQSRLAAGTYGRCERCACIIPAERLEARPEARWCVACAGL